jgi:hypothetical protein
MLVAGQVSPDQAPFSRLTRQLVRRPAEEFLRAAVAVTHQPVQPDDQHRVLRLIQQGGLLADPGLGLFLAGDVLQAQQDPWFAFDIHAGGGGQHDHFPCLVVAQQVQGRLDSMVSGAGSRGIAQRQTQRAFCTGRIVAAALSDTYRFHATHEISRALFRSVIIRAPDELERGTVQPPHAPVAAQQTHDHRRVFVNGG